jgi:hypothetical protein
MKLYRRKQLLSVLKNFRGFLLRVLWKTNKTLVRIVSLLVYIWTGDLLNMKHVLTTILQWLVYFLGEFVRNHEKERNVFYPCLLNQCKYYIGNTDGCPLRLNTSVNNNWYIVIKVVGHILILILFVKLLREILVPCIWTSLLCIHITVTLQTFDAGNNESLIHIQFWIFLLWLTAEHK